MKKFMLLFACLSLIAITGCKEKDNAPESLAGTEWKCSETVEGYTAELTLTFAESTFIMADNSMGETYQIKGRYTYVDSIVTLIENNDVEDALTGTVTDKTITFDDDGTVIVFTRQ